MADFTNYQKKLISRYYDRRDEIMLAKLAEIVSELAVGPTESKSRQLWQRVEKAMANLKIPMGIATHVMQKRDTALLARHLRTWLDEAARQQRR